MKDSFKSESKIYKFWQEEKYFSSPSVSLRTSPSTKLRINPSATLGSSNIPSKKVFSLLMPPPNLTGELHLGHALQHSIMDAVSRFKRLQGFDVLLLPGVDHAGIQFEATLEKKLSKEGKTKKSLGREKWLERAREFKDEIYKSFHDTWTVFGISADWSREVFTLDEGPRQAVFEAFKTFWDKGLIYKGPYIVQWCPKCNTAIEDVEMEYEERNEKLYYIKYPISNFKFQISNKSKAQQNFITIATTRPETIFADTAVAVYPNHPKYEMFVGSKVINPLTGHKIVVIEDKRVEKEFGTGALKITPAHDLLDYEIGRDHKLDILSAVGKDGRLSEICGEFTGLKVLEAREKVAEKLRGDGLIEQEEDYVHNVAVCERCKSVVEPLISEEWFVKMDELAKGAIKVINKEEIKFLPKNYKKILVEWLLNIHDWCISRSLWWGHRIPVWYPSTRSTRSGQVANVKVSLDSPGPGWVQDEQVLDTWFSSGLWPMSTLGWPGESQSGKSKWKEISKAFPWSFEISAPEIKYLWIARMIMLSVYFTGQIPFKTMFFHGMLRDLQGKKFSKSLGNGIEPQYLIDNWGVDATRMALYTYAIPGRDGRVSKATLDERGKNFRNFGTKLRNITKFVLELKPRPTGGHSRPDRESIDPRFREDDIVVKDNEWIMTELGKAINIVTKHLESLELHLAVDVLYEFVWHKFADKYIEDSKNRRVEAQPTLEHVLKQVLILLHPFMPFLTEELYQKFEVKRKSIMIEDWPSSNEAV